MPIVRSDSCPICRMSAAIVLEFDCAEKPPLGNSVCFRWCGSCDFLFAQNLDAEAYRAFYRAALNDTGHVSDADATDNLHRLQSALIRNHLGGSFRGNCLDYGCGEGQLLEHLSAQLPDATIFGTDLRNSLRPGSAARFLQNLAAAPVRFDLIILSHVAEHFVDLSEISTLVAHLAPGGSFFIEVPDALGYPDCPRREFMYYFDRLHVNHFSRTALTRWLAQYSLKVTRYGAHRFAYRDGKFPAQFVFASPGDAGLDAAASACSLRQAFDSYRDFETARARKLQKFILEQARGRDLLVYGRGDNFFRSRSPGGPLHRLKIAAILDRNATFHGVREDIPSVEPSKGLAQYPDAVVLLTVSVGAENIVKEIRASTPDRPVIVI